MVGTVFNIQRFSLFDGAGIRTVVFLKGCPLKCIWCHNPEGHIASAQIMYDPLRCIGCGECVAACPRSLHTVENSVHTYIRDNCDACGRCSEVCTSVALQTVGRIMSTDDVMKEVMKDLPLYRRSKGGLTLSGGEPLFQADFSLSLLKAAKESNIATAVETSGYAEKRVIAEFAKYTDVFLYDYKATGDEMHMKLCAVPQTPIIENLSQLDFLGATCILRCPIVPGLNDTPEHIHGIAKCAAEHTSIKEIQLEPYHRLGVSKAKKLGSHAAYDGEIPERKTLLEYCRAIEKASNKPASVS